MSNMANSLPAELAPPMQAVPLAESISDQEFQLFQQLFAERIGLALAPVKKAMLVGRLNRRLVALQLPNFRAYYQYIASEDGTAECQCAIDLITTNETFFFREPKHFDWLRQLLQREPLPQPLRVWSAACATGEEPYSLAMLLDEALGAGGFQLLASDISLRALVTARRGLYSMERSLQHLPPQYLKRYCLRGTGQYQGQLLIQRELREQVAWQQINLLAPPPSIGQFELVFLRNVMIYFDDRAKQQVLGAVTARVKPGGWLVVGHAETLLGIQQLPLQLVGTGIYRKCK